MHHVAPHNRGVIKPFVRHCPVLAKKSTIPSLSRRSIFYRRPLVQASVIENRMGEISYCTSCMHLRMPLIDRLFVWRNLDLHRPSSQKARLPPRSWGTTQLRTMVRDVYRDAVTSSPTGASSTQVLEISLRPTSQDNRADIASHLSL